MYNPWHIRLTMIVIVALAGCQAPTSNKAARVSPAASAGTELEQPPHSVVSSPTAPSSEAEVLQKISRIVADWKQQSGLAADQQIVARDETADLTTSKIDQQPVDGSTESKVPVVQASSSQVISDAVNPTQTPLVDVQPETFPVDLPTVLRLAGGRNWAVQLAWERINQAEANVTAAEAMWLPSLNVGIGATKHDGQIQATTGEVVDVSRNSLFVGGGAKVATAPMTGGAGGPARMFVDLSIADALFQPLVARQLSCAARSRHAVEFNDAQLEAAKAYFDLISAQGEISVVRQNLTDSLSLLAMTKGFVAAGKASQAEISRVQVIVANHQQSLVNAELKLKLASSELIRIVRLDPAQLSAESVLYSADDHLLPIELIPESSDLSSLIAQGQQTRPEVSEQYALAQARLADSRAQELRPFLPNLNLAVSGGGFGGGRGSDIDNFSGRGDLDAMLVWEVRNLGFGENAARCESCSRYRQAVLESHQMQDLIAAEVRNSWHQVIAGRQVMNIARANVNESVRVLELNLNRIRGMEGVPLEAIQALYAVSNSRLAYLNSVISYNKAQAELLRAVGRPVQNGLQNQPLLPTGT